MLYIQNPVYGSVNHSSEVAKGTNLSATDDTNR